MSADVLHEWSGTFIRHPLAAKKKCLAKITSPAIFLTVRSLRVTIAAEHERRRRRTGSRNAAEILVLVTLRDERRSKRRLRRSTG